MHTILVFGLIISPPNRGLQVTRNNNVALYRDKLALLSGLVLTIKQSNCLPGLKSIFLKLFKWASKFLWHALSFQP